MKNVDDVTVTWQNYVFGVINQNNVSQSEDALHPKLNYWLMLQHNICCWTPIYDLFLPLIKLSFEIGNMSQRQHQDQRAVTSRRPPKVLHRCEKICTQRKHHVAPEKKIVLVQWKWMSYLSLITINSKTWTKIKNLTRLTKARCPSGCFVYILLSI